MKIFHSFIDLIGHTPIVELHQIEEIYNLKSRIYAKIESFNPAGSVKDRVSKQMIIDAIDEGKLKLSDKISDFFPEVIEKPLEKWREEILKKHA